MCISTVYQNAVLPENILLKNVRAIRVEGDQVILTNILEQEMRVRGALVSADLIGGVVVIVC